MQRNNTIRIFISLILLLVFALGNTPRQWLHDAFANHKDCSGSYNSKSELSIQQQKVSCQCNDLVAESPFIGIDNNIEINVPGTSIILTEVLQKNLLRIYGVFIDLRGPPFYS